MAFGTRVIAFPPVMKKIRKAVFPAAGLGTRFLPATKAQPKEMLPLVDKPIIQYGVEEALHSGIQNIIIVTGRGKTAIEDHFDVSFELENMLETRGKKDLLAIDAEAVSHNGSHDRVFRIRDLVEKPKRSEAPSNLAIIGRYVLTPEIFDSIGQIEPGSGGELQLTDALRHQLRSRPIYAYRFE